MTDIDAGWKALLKLSASDLDKYNYDLVVYGSACVRELEDGRVIYVPPEDWHAQATGRVGVRFGRRRRARGGKP